jgi:hypothetical protein
MLAKTVCFRMYFVPLAPVEVLENTSSCPLELLSIRRRPTQLAFVQGSFSWGASWPVILPFESYLAAEGFVVTTLIVAPKVLGRSDFIVIAALLFATKPFGATQRVIGVCWCG